jgi:hypothetical protein
LEQRPANTDIKLLNVEPFFAAVLTLYMSEMRDRQRLSPKDYCASGFEPHRKRNQGK